MQEGSPGYFCRFFFLSFTGHYFLFLNFFFLRTEKKEKVSTFKLTIAIKVHFVAV